jgi:hypothetical protein
MKLFLRIILIGALTYFLSLIFPWWILAVVGFTVGLLIPGGSLSTFISGFLGIGIIWMGHAWSLDAKNDSQFTEVMIQVIGIVDDPIVLIAIVGLIGGLVGGFATMTGALLRQPAKKKGGSGYYN